MDVPGDAACRKCKPEEAAFWSVYRRVRVGSNMGDWGIEEHWVADCGTQLDAEIIRKALLMLLPEQVCSCKLPDARSCDARQSAHWSTCAWYPYGHNEPLEMPSPYEADKDQQPQGMGFEYAHVASKPLPLKAYPRPDLEPTWTPLGRDEAAAQAYVERLKAKATYASDADTSWAARRDAFLQGWHEAMAQRD